MKGVIKMRTPDGDSAFQPRAMKQTVLSAENGAWISLSLLSTRDSVLLFSSLPSALSTRDSALLFYNCRNCGSDQTRNQSPSRLAARTTNMMHRPGKTLNHQ